MIDAAAVDEVHRHVERPLAVRGEDVVAVERERQQAGARAIGVAPDPRAIGQEPADLAVVNGEHAKIAVATDCSAATAELLDHVGLVGEIEVHLHGRGPLHHVEAARADRRHVARITS